MNEIICLISSSPIVSHPSTSIIEETVRSIRFHLPEAPIYIMCDGVRPEQEQYKLRYADYLRNLASVMIAKWDNVHLYPFTEFKHQAVMTMATLEMAEAAPLLLFLEHDTPLLDRPIDWKMLKDAVLSGATNHIRFHLDEQIHPDHEFLMEGKLTDNLIKTKQWSQRPHFANRRWYAAMLADTFTRDSRTFIEDKIYGVVCSASWDVHRLTIYDPHRNGKQMKLSGDLNGRAFEPKYSLIF